MARCPNMNATLLLIKVRDIVWSFNIFLRNIHSSQIKSMQIIKCIVNVANLVSIWFERQYYLLTVSVLSTS